MFCIHWSNFGEGSDSKPVILSSIRMSISHSVDSPDPILNPSRKVAVVTGGASGFGFAAADQLLCKGARSVVITDIHNRKGIEATKHLCDRYGREQATFFQSDVRSEPQLEGVYLQTLRKHPEIHIIFNDIDNLIPGERSCLYCDNIEPAWNSTARATHIGMKYLGKQNGGPGGIIVNSATILGFMGWPENASPVYCHHNEVIGITRDLLMEYPLDRTGVRLVTLCPTNTEFESIGLPYDPADKVHPNKPCIPTSKSRIGPALLHVIAWAKTGTTWLVEPHLCLYELLRLIHFPDKAGKVDPKVYDKTPCPVGIQPHCAKTVGDKCKTYHPR